MDAGGNVMKLAKKVFALVVFVTFANTVVHFVARPSFGWWESELAGLVFVAGMATCIYLSLWAFDVV
jgi:F0F1-type ATP synthase membrane subunit a